MNEKQRAENEKLLREVTGNFTAAERKAMEKAERDNYNRNARAAAFWCGANEYQDYDGVWRKL